MPPDTRVWLVRHAETATPTIIHGAESDVDLGAIGVAQAAALADWFRPLAPTLVISSAMKRAVATARPVVEACGVPHHIEPGLHERRVGKLGGTSTNDLGAWNAMIDRWKAGDTGYSTHGAESFDEMRTRLLPAWERALADTAGGRVVVVAHGVVCKVLLLCLLDGHGPANWTDIGRVPNCAVSELVGVPGKGWRADSILEVPEPVRAVTQPAAVPPPDALPKSEG